MFYTTEEILQRTGGKTVDTTVYKCKLRTEAGLSLWVNVLDYFDKYMEGQHLAREAIATFEASTPNTSGEQYRKLKKDFLSKYPLDPMDKRSKDKGKRQAYRETAVFRAGAGHVFGGELSGPSLLLFFFF